MKTSIFDMSFVLPPLIEMVEVEKDMPSGTNANPVCSRTGDDCCVRPRLWLR